MTSMCLFGTLYALLPALFVVSIRVCLSVKTSKACYGSSGVPCTVHTLKCESGMIAIQDAYYTNSTACTVHGLPSCNINVKSIQDTGRNQDFNEIQVNNLYQNCSGRQSCTFNGVRKGTITFSIVKYICIKDSKDLCSYHDEDVSNKKLRDVSVLWTGNTTEDENNSCIFKFNTIKHHKTSVYALEISPQRICGSVMVSVNGENHSPNCSVVFPYQELVRIKDSANLEISINVTSLRADDRFWFRIVETAGSETGGIAVGVFAAVVVIGAVVALVFWFKYKRNKTPRVKTSKQDDSYFENTNVSKNVHNKEVTTNSRTNYDYATINDDVRIIHVGTDNYDLARKPVGNIMPQNRETEKIDEEEYNHLHDQKHITINGDKPSGYDTTASAAAAVRKLQTGSSSNTEDDYDYNHLSDNSDVKPTRSDYDTAASASRAVAQMVKDKDTAEDDYDHFHKKGAKSSDSPYDTTEQCVNETDYSLAGTVDKNDPYDLAK